MGGRLNSIAHTVNIPSISLKILAHELYVGYVTHGCDRLLWAYRIPSLEKDQIEVAKAWLNEIATQVDTMNKSGKYTEINPRTILSLNGDKSISWIDDAKWEGIMKLKDIFR